MITVWIDELTTCLKDSDTGEMIDTECIPVKRASVLRKFNKKNGWYVDWYELSQTDEIYALVIAGTYDVQGLVAVRSEENMQAAFVTWMVAAPQNNPQITAKKKYIGVGGHLFAIAAKMSVDYGYEGYLTGFAANSKLEEHYIANLGATHIGMLHPYQFEIDEEKAKEIMEAYVYDWSDYEF